LKNTDSGIIGTKIVLSSIKTNDIHHLCNFFSKPEFIDPDGFAPFSHASELMNFEPEQAAKVITPPNKGRDHSHHWDGRGTFI
jgi:hypothetical protein